MGAFIERRQKTVEMGKDGAKTSPLVWFRLQTHCALMSRHFKALLTSKDSKNGEERLQTYSHSKFASSYTHKAEELNPHRRFIQQNTSNVEAFHKVEIELPISLNNYGPSAHYLPHLSNVAIPHVNGANAVRFGDFVQLRNKHGMFLNFDMWTTRFVQSNRFDEKSLGKDEFEVFVGPINENDVSNPTVRHVFQIQKYDTFF